MRDKCRKRSGIGIDALIWGMDGGRGLVVVCCEIRLGLQLLSLRSVLLGNQRPSTKAAARGFDGGRGGGSLAATMRAWLGVLSLSSVFFLKIKRQMQRRR